MTHLVGLAAALEDVELRDDLRCALPALVGCEKTTSVFEVHEQV